jgi:3-oxoacyl-[acyl-carrier protein] reductase
MAERRGETKTALVTGGSAGIGAAIALALSAEGYGVIINGRRPEEDVSKLLRSLNKKGNKSLYVRGDIAEASCRDQLVEKIREEYGRLSVLVNNAGITTKNRKDMLVLTEAEIFELLKVNLIAPFLLSSALSPLMKNYESPSSYISYIVNISSISAYTASTNRADYCISKAGISMMTKLFADRLAADNIRVFEVRPGIIKTDMTAEVTEKYDRLIDEGLLPIGRWGEPSDVARAVLGIVLGYHPYSTGSVIDVDGGFNIRRL